NLALPPSTSLCLDFRPLRAWRLFKVSWPDNWDARLRRLIRAGERGWRRGAFPGQVSRLGSKSTDPRSRYAGLPSFPLAGKGPPAPAPLAGPYETCTVSMRETARMGQSF